MVLIMKCKDCENFHEMKTKGVFKGICLRYDKPLMQRDIDKTLCEFKENLKNTYCKRKEKK